MITITFHISHTSTNPDMTQRWLLEMPLPPPPTPYDHLRPMPNTT